MLKVRQNDFTKGNGFVCTLVLTFVTLHSSELRNVDEKLFVLERLDFLKTTSNLSILIHTLLFTRKKNLEGILQQSCDDYPQCIDDCMKISYMHYHLRAASVGILGYNCCLIPIDVIKRVMHLSYIGTVHLIFKP